VSDAPGTLVVTIDDRVVSVDVVGGDSYELPVGPLALRDGPLGADDPPSAINLTNALGLVQDHLDDLIIADPSIAAPPRVVAAGRHADALARVEIGADSVPEGYELAREDADEVFRTLALERRDDRRFNPGLDPDHVESIIGTCCVILGIMRRLDLRGVTIPPTVPPAALSNGVDR
jgi:exopolyphosphatase/pppGpp-phosphohydrolase